MLLLVAALFAFGIMIIFAGIAKMIAAPTRTDAVLEQYGRPKALEQVELAQPFSMRVARPILRRIAALALRYTPQEVMDTTRQKLDLAGNPFDLPPIEFIGLRAVSAVVGALGLSLLFNLLNSGNLLVLGMVVVGGVLGFYVPLLWLNARIRTRQEDILVNLPDALDLLTVCAEAGLGLDAAFGQLVNKWDNELSKSFARLSFELRLGKSREVALRDLSDRAGVPEMTNFIAAVIQAEKFGTGIARVLRVQSEQQRVLRRQRAQDRANQLPVKLLVPLTFLIFPSVLIVILGPAVIRILEAFK